MDLNEKIQLGHLNDRFEVMKGMGLSEDEINDSFSKSEKDILHKTIPIHKVEKGVDYSITKSEEETPSKERKVALVMKEFKEGKLKSSSGEVVTDRDKAIAIAMSEAGLSKEKSEGDGLEKGGEGSRGGIVIGHTQSGKPIYEHQDPKHYTDFSTQDHDEASDIHHKKAMRYDMSDPERKGQKQIDLRNAHYKHARNKEK